MMSAEEPQSLELLYEARQVKDETGNQLPYRFLAPRSEIRDGAPDQKFPLVLFLHGAGERGDDNKRQFIHGLRDLSQSSLRGRHPSFVVAPQCPSGQRWVDVNWGGKTHEMKEQPTPPMQTVLSLIHQLLKTEPVDPDRIYVVGLSMGGYGTFDLVQRHPELIAAGIAICGGGDPSRGTAFQQVPMWVVHGSADPVVPVVRSQAMVAAIRKAGGVAIYTEYDGVGHDSWSETFANALVWDWLYAQRKQSR